MARLYKLFILTRCDRTPVGQVFLETRLRVRMTTKYQPFTQRNPVS
ncbi:MAG: hypothetical protein RIE73_36265 [Coleofasciculus sp. C1-SOL-03]